VFDNRGGAIGGELGFGRGDLGRERLVGEDGSDPAREVVGGAVVAQHARVADREFGLEYRQVGGARPCRGVTLVLITVPYYEELLRRRGKSRQH
jgi:hypothetical protein